MSLPESFCGRVFLGFDEIERSHLIGAQSAPVVLGEGVLAAAADPLVALHRRWIAAMLPGTAACQQTSLRNVEAEIATLRRNGFPTAAGLLDALSRATAPGSPPLTDTFLATALYLRHARYKLAQSRSALARTSAE